MTTLRALECLVALVEHGSMSAAATSLYMSQPALSHQIAALEKELGVPVVERQWRGVRVTVAGRAVAEEARVALRAAEKAVQIGRRVGSGGAGRLRISCVETMTAWLLVPVLRQWRSRRPDVHLDLSEFTSADAMVEILASGGSDVAVGPRPTRTEAHVEVFGQQEMVVVAPAGHRFAELAAVPVRALADETFVHYDPVNGMATWVDQLAAHHNIVLNSVLRTRSPSTAAQLAAAGMGVTIVPVSALVPRPTGVIRRLGPTVKVDVIAMVAAPADTLVQAFIADLHRHGLPNSLWEQ
ncbi:MAG TPA: LysR family transcriptional regulator [Mycobacterium sp.]|jgi:DNA-binding transcriptional LysR family regulator|uniref:LysR family transcriptional regulator n=1 Tax=Mycobacterium sp. TaxID=1785 RepID=UPI002F3F2AFF